MAPQKRTRPSFSPPRPGKQKAKSSTRNTNSTSTITKKNKSGLKVGDKSAKSKQSTGKIQPRSRLVSPTPSASDSLGGDDTSDPDSNDDHDENNDLDMRDQSEPATSDSEVGHDDKQPPVSSSPEPDYILAEISHPSPRTAAAENTNPILPLDLLHHILRSHFSKPDETKLSRDAREVVGKYIEIFVREAIMRCAYEGTEAEKAGGANGGGQGWLEVDTLERVAVQLCLDF